MWLVSTPGAVPLAQRIELTCRTDVLRLEVSSKVRVAPPSKIGVKVKDIEREGRAVRRVVARRLARSAEPIQADPTYRRVIQLIEQPPNSPVPDDSHGILAMIERARVSGITPLEAELRMDGRDSHRDGVRGDTNIGVAILNGEAYFYRRGHHRLAIANGLGIPEVPVDILLWDSAFNGLREAARVDLLAALGIRQPPATGPTTEL